MPVVHAPTGAFADHSSVAVVGDGTCPPKFKANVDVPAPPNACLAVLKSATSVQADPFHDSFITSDPVPGVYPEKAKAAVVFPAPAK